MQQEFEFSLPKGYVDDNGKVHKSGLMRLSTAMDEIAPLRDMRVRNNQAYLTVAILARVITRLGDLSEINTTIIEKLFTGDLAYLQDFYRRINSDGESAMNVTCPNCAHTFQVETNPAGGS
ncbi:MAG: phage tail assembly protein [Chloroflexi bacterium]|nr:phage tail assembly protein [Chloroflexota bacterium]